MLTSNNPSNQYLRPEYLSPLPTTMDNKQSPLALLAQTCSSIGADSPNPKLIANMEKSAKSHHKLSSSSSTSSSHHQSSAADLREKLSPGSQSSLSNSSSDLQQQKSSFKPYESSLRDVRTTTSPDDQQRSNSVHRIKTPKMQQHQNGRCGSNQSASSPRASPANNNNIRKTPSSSYPEKSASPHCASSTPTTKSESYTPSSSLSSDSPLSLTSNKYTDSLKDTLSKSSSLTLPTVSTPSYLSAYPPGSFGSYPMDLMTASALMSPHHSMALKAAALNPYLNYARMKGPGGSESLMPVCRDPYCTGCALSPHMMGKQNSTCPAGCTQCDHPANKAAAAYAHAQLAAFAAASQLPYVCSWVAGDASYCGKRFSTPEELLQHLRTHTSSMSESMLNPAAAAAAAGIPPNHPLFQRTYPTPPLSPLSTSRYHPYSKPTLLPPSLGPPSLAGLQMPTHPSLAQYFSPYSLYGPRLGAQPGMHP